MKQKESLKESCIHPGDFISFNGIWNGLVVDVYHGSFDTVIEIFYVKNVFRGQPPELVKYSDVDGMLYKMDEGVDDEILEYTTKQAARLNSFITRKYVPDDTVR